MITGLIIVLATVVIAVLITFGIAYYGYREVFYYKDERTNEERWEIPKGEQYEKEADNMRSLIGNLALIPAEWVTITSFDGLKLAGRYYHVRDGAPVQIQLHGYHSDGIRDFCGGNMAARAMGMNTLVIDQRAHGRSEGHTVSFGICERRDCLSWIEYVVERFGDDQQIILAGLSMGAATVLMASELNLPENVKGIIADCPYSSQKEIICNVGKQMKLPMKLLYPFIKLGAQIFGHFNLSETSPLEAIRHAKVPILLIHGEDDRFVPCEMSRELYKSCSSDKILVTVPEAGHGISYILDKEKYTNAVKEFAAKCLNV